MDGCTLEECATAQIFETEQVYKVHGNMEVKDMVDFAYRNTPQYLDDQGHNRHRLHTREIS